jgi:hypothetical protein
MKTIKTILAVVTILAFAYALGLAGALECETIAMSEYILNTIICVCTGSMSVLLLNLFDR